MNFDHPLLLIPAIALGTLVVWAFVRLWRARRSDDLLYSDIAFFADAVKARRFPGRALGAIAAIAVGLLCMAVAGPHLLFPVPEKDAAVFLCIDTSGSMASTDVAPTRAEAAVRAARAFIDRTPDGVRTGIISFATAAQVVVPLTTDREEAIAGLAQIPPANGATAIGDALQLAQQGLGTRGHRAIVLITDGVNNRGADPDAVATDLAAAHIRVFTIGIGTNSGDVIPGTNEAATIDEEALRRYAESTGGTYVRADDAGQLTDALARLGATTTLEVKRVDATLAFALIGAALLIASVLTYIGMGK